MKKLIYVIFALALLGASFMPAAVLGQSVKTMEDAFTPDLEYSKTVDVQTSTTSATGLGASWAVLAIGGEATYTVETTTKTFSPVLGNIPPSIDASSVITAPDGITVGSEWRTLAKDPKIVIHSLDAGATAHVWIDYMKPIGQ